MTGSEGPFLFSSIFLISAKVVFIIIQAQRGRIFRFEIIAILNHLLNS